MQTQRTLFLLYTRGGDQTPSFYHQSEQTSPLHHSPPLIEIQTMRQNQITDEPLSQYQYLNCHRHNRPWWCVVHFSCCVYLPDLSELKFLLHLNCCHPNNVIHCWQWLPVLYHKHRAWCIQFQKGIGRILSSSNLWAITYFLFFPSISFPTTHNVYS